MGGGGGDPNTPETKVTLWGERGLLSSSDLGKISAGQKAQAWGQLYSEWRLLLWKVAAAAGSRERGRAGAGGGQAGVWGPGSGV